MGFAGKEAIRPPSRAALSRSEPARSFAREAALSPEALQRRFGNRGTGALLASLSGGGGAAPPVRSASSLGSCGSSQLQAGPAAGTAYDGSAGGAGAAVDRVMRMEGAQPAEGSGQLQAASDVVAHAASDDPGPAPVADRQTPAQADDAETVGSAEVTGVLTPHDNFTGRSLSRFGVAEKIDLGFVSTRARPATKFEGGLQWVLSAPVGTLAPIPGVGTGTYMAPATADSVQLELQVASGKKAGRVLSAHPITIVEPDMVKMVALPLAGFFSPGGGMIEPGVFGAGFLAHVYIGPNDVSFRFVEFHEGIVMAVIDPPASFLGQPVLHPPSNFGFGVGGDSAKGTMTDGVDQIASIRLPGGRRGAPSCGYSNFVWEIPWEFLAGGTGPGKKFATATHHLTSTPSCKATIEKGGAGPFCRQIDGTTC